MVRTFILLLVYDDRDEAVFELNEVLKNIVRADETEERHSAHSDAVLEHIDDETSRISHSFGSIEIQSETARVPVIVWHQQHK